jgi:hypothetical protein
MAINRAESWASAASMTACAAASALSKRSCAMERAAHPNANAAQIVKSLFDIA